MLFATLWPAALGRTRCCAYESVCPAAIKLKVVDGLLTRVSMDKTRAFLAQTKSTFFGSVSSDASARLVSKIFSRDSGSAGSDST